MYSRRRVAVFAVCAVLQSLKHIRLDCWGRDGELQGLMFQVFRLGTDLLYTRPKPSPSLTNFTHTATRRLLYVNVHKESHIPKWIGTSLMYSMENIKNNIKDHSFLINQQSYIIKSYSKSTLFTMITLIKSEIMQTNTTFLVSKYYQRLSIQGVLIVFGIYS